MLSQRVEVDADLVEVDEGPQQGAVDFEEILADVVVDFVCGEAQHVSRLVAIVLDQIQQRRQQLLQRQPILPLPSFTK